MVSRLVSTKSGDPFILGPAMDVLKASRRTPWGLFEDFTHRHMPQGSPRRPHRPYL